MGLAEGVLVERPPEPDALVTPRLIGRLLELVQESVRASEQLVEGI